MPRKSFAQFMQEVDNLIDAKYGLTSADLPDCDYYDMYEDGCTPSRAANRAIKNADSY